MKTEDNRKIPLQLHDQGLTSRKIVKNLGSEIGKTIVNRWVKMFRESGEVNLKSPSGGEKVKTTQKSNETNKS